MQIRFIVKKNNKPESDHTDTFVTGKTFAENVKHAYPNFACFAEEPTEMFLDAKMNGDYYSVHAIAV